jgi:uncharacterized membrane protein YphA (DoxX/SURF4 family)
MVAAGVYADLGALLLAAFLVPTTLLAHGFWKLTDPDGRAARLVDQFSQRDFPDTAPQIDSNGTVAPR